MVLTQFQFYIFNLHNFWESKKVHILIKTYDSCVNVSYDWTASVLK